MHVDSIGSTGCRAFSSLRFYRGKRVPVQVHVKSAAQKIQRFQVAEQFESAPVKANGHAQAGHNIKYEVLNAWEQELGSCPVETDNFFSSGGDSMQAEILACTLSSRLGLSVDSALIYGNPEPARLAAALQEQISSTASQELPAHSLVRVPDEQRSAGIPVAGTWRASYLTISAQSAAIKIGAFADLQGPLNIDALRESHKALLERHESLRTVFRLQPRGQMPVMHIQPMSDKLQDFSMETADSELAAVNIAQCAAEQEYDQTTGPLTRLRVIRLGEERHWLILTAHHGVADRLSLGVMKQDLSDLYNSIVNGQEPQLAELTVQDSDYMAWLQQQEIQGAYMESYAYWQNHFAALNPGLWNPVNTNTAPPNTQAAPYTLISISPEAMHSVEQTAQDHQTTAMVVILSAYAEATAETLERNGLLASIVTSARDQPALKSMVSCITTPLPISLPQAGSGQLSTLLSQASNNLAAARQHNIPYHLLQEAAGDKAKSLPFLTLNADQDLTSTPFTFQGIRSSRLDDIQIGGQYARAALIAYRRILMFLRAGADGGLVGGLAWNPAFLDDEQGQRISARFQALLGSSWN